MPKVLRIINRLNLGGPTYNVSYLSKYIDESYQTLLIAGMHDESEASSEFITSSMGIKPVYINEMRRSIHPLKDYSAYQEIDTIIKEFKPDIVHTHAAKAGALGRLAAHRNKVPVIVHTFHGHVFHSYFSPFKTRVFLEIERYLASLSTSIIAISQEQKRELTEYYNVCPPQKVTVIPLGFDLSRFQNDMESKRIRFRKDYNLAEDEIAIGIIGRLVPIKNHSLFIRSIKKLTQVTHKKVRAFIIGDGEAMGETVELAKAAGLKYIASDFKKDKAVLTFTSWIKEIDYALAGLDIVALTSNNEGTPVSLIEAQAAGKPIVSTRVGGIADVVIEGETALLSPSGDVDSLTANLLSLVENHELLKRMGVKGYDHVNKKFTYTRLATDTTQLYDRLLFDRQTI